VDQKPSGGKMVVPVTGVDREMWVLREFYNRKPFSDSSGHHHGFNTELRQMDC
jgi:hypothetical protein